MISEEEFTKIYNQLAEKVLRLCLGYASGNIDLAKDWQQETFVKVWNNRKSFKADSSVNTWIYRIAVNVCLSDLRKASRKKSLVDNFQPESEEAPSDTADQIKQLYGCIDKLNRQNKTLILMELEEIPQATIAETVGLKHGTVRTRLNRIRASLLKCMTHGK